MSGFFGGSPPGAEITANKNAVNGYAGLDGAGRITTALLPTFFIGMIFRHLSPDLPALCQWPDGRNVSRTTYSLAFAALTKTFVGTTTNGSPTITTAMDLRGLGLIGAKIEGPGLPSGAVISSITATTVVLTSGTGVTAQSSQTYRIFPYGNGDGSTTFGLPDARGRALIIRDDIGGTAAGRMPASGPLDGTVLGRAGGDYRLQDHTHSYAVPNILGAGTSAGNSINAGSIDNTLNTSSPSIAAGSGQNVQPSLVCNAVVFMGQ